MRFNASSEHVTQVSMLEAVDAATTIHEFLVLAISKPDAQNTSKLYGWR